MSLAWLASALAVEGEAIWRHEGGVSYAELRQGVTALRARLRAKAWGLDDARVFGFGGDYSLEGVVRLLALLLEGRVAVPLAQAQPEALAAAQAAARLDAFWPQGAPLDAPPQRLDPGPRHPLLAQLGARAGLIILTSGSSGAPKVILHDAAALFDGLRHPRRPYRVLAFLLPDHMGGLNTLMGALTSGGAVVIPRDRAPESVCAAVSASGATLLPVTPSFLNLLLLSEAHTRHDLSSLRVISYGTEVMPPRTLAATRAAFPQARIIQLYGSSELGILRGKPGDEAGASLRFEGAQARVIEGRLYLKPPRAMLGYLSGEPSGFDAEGFFDTGDQVEVHGEGLRILGRISELINVGGLKVTPAEVEDALLGVAGVIDCVVAAAPHPMLGQVVVARVQLSTDEDALTFKRRMRRALAASLEPYKLPVRVTRVEGLVGRRWKRVRA
ncbi:fatty acid--CoA ligase family protein [Myxococcota bacterium]|nr:fatty acid--CoA ligase family protein [Myxococcota bacterium]MBU1430253.1 fatty acid--CoA ligase family protein [Myxococcota bacterium]MBU1898802.1 fatty acid--CoA ligase family protein [Myxococcota bacterium]